MMTAQDIGYRAGALEVPAASGAVFYRPDGCRSGTAIWSFFRVDALLLGAQEIAIVEFGQVERMSVFGLATDAVAGRRCCG
ncbi:hypothetical protein MJ579_26685 [Klebsiella pneumoniae]|nr:hypothetical protein MJ579_26685 [Klebsiella pneumoniae]